MRPKIGGTMRVNGQYLFTRSLGVSSTSTLDLASNDLIVALCAAVASLAAGALLSLVGYWAVGVVFGTLLALAVPGLLRLQEPTVGVYVETPTAELAGRTA